IQDLESLSNGDIIENGKLIYIPTEESIDGSNKNNYVTMTFKALDACLISEAFSLFIFIEPECYEGICVIDSDMSINDTIIGKNKFLLVKDHLTITNKAVIKIDRRLSVVIINDKDELVNI